MTETRKLTYSDYASLPEDGKRYELLDGELIEMASPISEHQTAVFELGRQLGNALKGKPCRGFVSPLDVRFVLPGQSPDTSINVVQPDLMVVCDPYKIDRHGIVGAPDFVVEVLSPTNLAHDQVRKLSLYESFGVAEYWIVDSKQRWLDQYVLARERYSQPRRLGFIHSAVPVYAIPWLTLDLVELACELDLCDRVQLQFRAP